MKNLALVITAIAAVGWPVLLGFCLWKVMPVLSSRLSAGAVTVKMFGVEVSLQDASENFGKQLADLQQKVAELRAVAEHSHPHLLQDLAPEDAEPLVDRILWVDDNPTNNMFEVARLRGVGIAIDQVTSTDEALASLAHARYSKVITDMERVEGGVTHPKAGLELMRRMKANDFVAPVFVYCSQRAVDVGRDALLAEGAAGVTASPLELFEHLGLVGTHALGGSTR